MSRWACPRVQLRCLSHSELERAYGGCFLRMNPACLHERAQLIPYELTHVRASESVWVQGRDTEIGIRHAL
eukprot:scaffold25032_cov52-Phaeocystis_antarctica.AAC.2